MTYTVTFETSEPLTSDDTDMLIETIMELGGNEVEVDEED